MTSKLVSSTFTWSFFVLGLGLVPLWYPAYTRWIEGGEAGLVDAVCSGLLVFYGYGQALSVLILRWSEVFVRWADSKRVEIRGASALATELVIPGAVCFLTFPIVTAMMNGAVPLSDRMFISQILALILAVGSSLRHKLWITYVNHERDKLDAAGAT